MSLTGEWIAPGWSTEKLAQLKEDLHRVFKQTFPETTTAFQELQKISVGYVKPPIRHTVQNRKARRAQAARDRARR